jgi:hypothetical protein
MPDNYVMQSSQNPDTSDQTPEQQFGTNPLAGDNSVTQPTDNPAAEIQSTLNGGPPAPTTPSSPGTVGALANGISAQADTRPTLQTPGLWERVLTGALSGLARGGVGGSILSGAASASPDLYNRQRIARAQQQQEAQQALQEGSARLAHAQIVNQTLQKNWDNMPDGLQDTLMQESAKAGAQLKTEGNNPLLSGLTEDAAKQFLTHAYDSNPNQASHYVVHADGSGKFDVFKISDPNAMNKATMTITTALQPGKNGDGSLDFDNPTPVTVEVPPGSVKVADAQASPVIAAQNYWNAYNKNQSTVQQKVQIANQTGVTAKNVGSANASNAKAVAAANAAAGPMFTGSLPDGTQVAGTASEMRAAGVQNVYKMGQTQQTQTSVARQLISPNGLFALINQDIQSLDEKGKLGPVAGNFANFLASKGVEPDFTPLKNHLMLLSTALMQAHMGNRGGKDIMEHFSSMVPPGSSPANIRAALGSEYSYVKEKAMLPPASKGGQ